MNDRHKGKGGGEMRESRGREREKGTLVSDMSHLAYMEFTFSRQSLGPGEQNTRPCVYPGSGDEIS